MAKRALKSMKISLKRPAAQKTTSVQQIAAWKAKLEWKMDAMYEMKWEMEWKMKKKQEKLENFVRKKATQAARRGKTYQPRRDKEHARMVAGAKVVTDKLEKLKGMIKLKQAEWRQWKDAAVNFCSDTAAGAMAAIDAAAKGSLPAQKYGVLTASMKPQKYEATKYEATDKVAKDAARLLLEAQETEALCVRACNISEKTQKQWKEMEALCHRACDIARQSQKQCHLLLELQHCIQEGHGSAALDSCIQRCIAAEIHPSWIPALQEPPKKLVTVVPP